MSINFGQRQICKNLFLNIAAFVVQFAINFYIAPMIVSNVGAAAYGFIGVANDFVSYVSIVAVIFNSVAARFISEAFYKNEIEKANKYFNSLIIANVIIAACLSAVGIIIVPLLDKLLVIPVSLILDVKLTFALIFGSYIVTLVTQVFATATFITNRTDINGIRNIIQYIIRFSLIIIFLNFISVRIYWVAVASFIATVAVAVMNIRLTKRLTPEIKIGLRFAKRSYVAELAKAGCWMAITSISNILLRGLDLTIANIMLGDYDMGILSIARTMPNNISSVVSVLAPLFTPAFISLYTQKNVERLKHNVNKTINSMALIMFVPITGFIVFFYDFYALWQSSLNESELILVTILSAITAADTYFNAVTAPMAQLSVVVNKLKTPVFASLICGVVSVISEVLLIKFTELGLLAVVIPTTIVMITRYMLFNSVYAACCVGVRKSSFLPSALKAWCSVPLLLVMMLGVRWLLPVSSWMTLCVDAVICAATGYIIMAVIYARDDIKRIVRRWKI